MKTLIVLLCCFVAGCASTDPTCGGMDPNYWLYADDPDYYSYQARKARRQLEATRRKVKALEDRIGELEWQGLKRSRDL